MVQMPSPTLCKTVLAALLPHPATDALHLVQILIHTLGFIEPLLLGDVAGQHVPFQRKNLGDCGVKMRFHGLPQAVLQPMGKSMIQGDGFFKGLGRRIGHRIPHPSHESARDDQTGGVLVVLHVILGKMGQDDVGLDLTDHGGHSRQGRRVVKNAQVRKKRRMRLASSQLGRGLRLPPAHFRSAFAVQRIRSAAAIRQVPQMQGTASLAQQQKRARHHKLNVIRVGGSSENNHGFRGPRMASIALAVL